MYFTFTDNRPPGMVPAKGRYIGRDIKRMREFYQMPIKAPKVKCTVFHCSHHFKTTISNNTSDVL